MFWTIYKFKKFDDVPHHISWHVVYHIYSLHYFNFILQNNYAYKTKLRHKTNEIMDTWFPLNFVQNTPFCVTMQILSMINYKKCQQITKSYVWCFNYFFCRARKSSEEIDQAHLKARHNNSINNNGIIKIYQECRRFKTKCSFASGCLLCFYFYDVIKYATSNPSRSFRNRRCFW